MIDKNNQDIKDIIHNNGTDWRQAVRDIVDYLIDNNMAFSSGEIAAVMRLVSPGLRFGVLQVGDIIRNHFYSAGSNYTVATRHVSDDNRTPEGHEVFVYAPSYQEAMDHKFEVNIPKPKQDSSPTPNKSFSSTNPPFVPSSAGNNSQTKKATKRTSTPPAQPAGYFNDYYAVVQGDGRIRVPAAAFRSFSNAGNYVAKGSTVYVTVSQNKATITTKPTSDSSQERTLTRDEGYLKFSAYPYVDWGDAGDNLSIKINNGEMSVIY